MPRVPKYTAVAAASLAPSPRGLFCGTSGWAYPTWKPGFYPAEVPSRAFLYHYGSKLTSVEVNYTFGSLPTKEQLAGWLEATPPGFLFTFKAPQRITHFQRLVDCGETLTEFLVSIEASRKAGKLGTILFQLPPNFKADTARLTAFLKLAGLKRHRIAFEFRHPSWFVQETYDLLQKYNAALCIAETEDLVTPDVQTADFSYYRLRRAGGYAPKKLQALASQFRDLSAKGDVFAYFMHEDEPTGALNAVSLLKTANKLAGVR